MWKTSYRVDLGTKESKIQGWAQIDNPTGEAWENVTVSLLSGAPVSFIMNLYDPLYTNRTTLPVPGGQVAAPRQYESALKTEPTFSNSGTGRKCCSRRYFRDGHGQQGFAGGGGGRGGGVAAARASRCRSGAAATASRLRRVQLCFNRRTRLESKTFLNTSFLFLSASRAVKVRCCHFFRKR